jgi:hypothetical protein
VLEESDELLELLGRWTRLKDREREAAGLRDERKQVEDQLVELGVPEGESLIGDVIVRRTPTKPRETFQYGNARKAGAWTPLDDERFGPFVRVGEPSERWDVIRV